VAEAEPKLDKKYGKENIPKRKFDPLLPNGRHMLVDENDLKDWAQSKLYKDICAEENPESPPHLTLDEQMELINPSQKNILNPTELNYFLQLLKTNLSQSVKMDHLFFRGKQTIDCLVETMVQPIVPNYIFFE
jgi:hypothetical protein